MKILKRVCFGLFILIIAIYLFIVIAPKMFDGFYPFGIKTAIVLTGSMHPTIEINDFVIMKKPDVISVGDIVSYKEESSGTEVLHRVVKIDGSEVVTKGDANNTNDQPIDMSQITGIYIGNNKFLGKIISFTTKPVVFSIIVVFLLIITFIPNKKNKTGVKNEANKTKEL